MMFIRGISGKRRAGAAPVYLNVYDLTPINGYAYWLGLGVYHSGVQVHGVEYAYGAHEHPTTGIFEGEPRQCPGFRFRRSILIGRTDLGPREVRALMEELATEYTGDTYNLISKNCNHFCDDACLRLSSTPIPKWVNRLAKIGTYVFKPLKSISISISISISTLFLGFLCKCVLPVHVAAVRRRGEEEEELGNGERARLRSNSTRNPPSIAAAPTTSSSVGTRSVRRIRRSFSSSSSSSTTKTSLVGISSFKP